MRYLTLIFLALLFFGCSNIDYPDGFVTQVIFTSDIIDVEKMQITSKDELIESVDTTIPYNDIVDPWGLFKYRCYRLVVNRNTDFYDSDEMIIHISPTSNNKLILDKNIYKSGMPIIFKPHYAGVSKQPVILIKGKSEWADSSYKGFTILPVANEGNENDLDFNWTIKKI